MVSRWTGSNKDLVMITPVNLSFSQRTCHMVLDLRLWTFN